MGGFILGFLAGAALGVGITMFIMVSIIKKTNDWGDYDGAADTVESFTMIKEADKVKESFSVYEKD